MGGGVYGRTLPSLQKTCAVFDVLANTNNPKFYILTRDLYP